MDTKEYLEKAMRTNTPEYDEIKLRLAHKKTIDLLHASLGMSTEANEVLDMVKKHLLYGKELDLKELSKEIGDTMWYMALALSSPDLNFSDIMEDNIQKLYDRYPNGFTEAAAIERVDIIKN
jgi:NTP pyrophosphatase (non-canonical NTP hydrolase)